MQFILLLSLLLLAPHGVGASELAEDVDVVLPQVVSATPIVSKAEIGLTVVATEALAYDLRFSSSPSKVIVDIPHVQWNEPPADVGGIVDTALTAFRYSMLPDEGMRLVLDLAYSIPQWEDSDWQRRDDGLYELTIKASRQFVQTQKFPIAPGIDLAMQRRGELYGPVVVNVIALNKDAPNSRLAIGLAKQSSLGLEPLSSIAQRRKALAAVNGTFFHYTGLPLGLLVDRGVLISAPVHDRTAFIVLRDGAGAMERAATKMKLLLPDGTSVPIHGVNRAAKSGEIVIYNAGYGTLSPIAGPGEELVLRKGTVVCWGEGETPLAPGTTVIKGNLTGKLRMLEAGQPCQVVWELYLPDRGAVIPGDQVWFALGAGPRLVANGQVTVTAAAESFRSDVSEGRAPRTAIGFSAEGTLLLVTVNGRQMGVSMGMTLEELAILMTELGAVEAMNLDGGGSTTMVVRDRVVSMPSEGEERAVSNGLLVIVDAAEAEDPSEVTPGS